MCVCRVACFVEYVFIVTFVVIQGLLSTVYLDNGFTNDAEVKELCYEALKSFFQVLVQSS